MTDPLTQYKLIVLYMLDRVDFSLTKAQIFDFVLEKEYTNYFTLQKVVFELIESDLISSKSVRNSSHLSITEEGRNTLSYFSNRISDSIKADVNDYFKDKELELRNEISVQSTFYKTTGNDYAAHLVAKEKKEDLVDITITVPTEESAVQVCENWQKKSQEIYSYLMDHLL
ncbi:MAG TPA: DUF4364 family protein [Lachnospiraceae bacterium]|jgi:hypothetical protein|nr:DUF4364 family protein [Lachnospiraceae bacterium]